jgi:hypothetical protein
MCCTTHDDRDALALADGSLAALLAPGENYRCRCEHGVPCRRKATGEDLSCDWCREVDHVAWWQANMTAGFFEAAVNRPVQLSDVSPYSVAGSYPGSAFYTEQYIARVVQLPQPPVIITGL